MKAVFVLLLATLVAASEVKLRDGITPQKLPPVDVAELFKQHIDWEYLKEVALTEGELRSGYIVADVTDYALEVITNLQVLLIEKGFEPMELADQKINLIPTGDIKLTDGYFSDLSTIKLSDEVMVKYSMDNKILELTLPLAFDTLLINYDYKTTIILLKITGTVAAKITEVRLGLTMGFNFSSYHAFVDEINMKNSGSISFKFTGLGLLDWVIDAMSVVLLTLFKGIVLSVINTVIYIPVHSVVNTINSFIDEILLRNGTAFF